MDSHACEAVIVTCIDYRFQEYINKWILENSSSKSFDRIAIAGGVKSLDIIMGQIETAHRLHHIKKVVLINHEDCGAYGDPPAPPEAGPAGGQEKHAEDLKNAAISVKQKFPNLAVETYYLHLDGTFEPIS